MINKVANRSAPFVKPPSAVRGPVQESTKRLLLQPPDGQLDSALHDLQRGRCVQLSTQRRIELAEACIHGIVRTAREWVDAACQAKGIEPSSDLRAEEVVSGPVITVRFLRLLIQSLRDIEEHGAVRIPGKIQRDRDGRLRIPVVPVKGLFDPILFRGFSARVRMREGVTLENLNESLGATYRSRLQQDPQVALVLGAGNVSGIPATDMLTKIFQENCLVLLKMHPVNDYLGPIFEEAFDELIAADRLRIIYGGADVGSAAVSHELVDEVHITGAIESHNRIVWGAPGPECQQRMDDNEPALCKKITSELGNVSPWTIVPGRYTEGQLKFQAEHVASSIVNNAAFNCVATRLLITCKSWPQRERFLELVQQTLDRIPPRTAYYPGAVAPSMRFTGSNPDRNVGGALPWKLDRGIDPAEDSLYFKEESFVCVCAETPLQADSPQDFLRESVRFMNERLWGTLCAAITVPAEFRRRPEGEQLLQSCLGQLRYGSIGINSWPGVIYALISPPWGGYPGSSLDDAQSGSGWVHNSYMLDNVEKTILEGPLSIWPKPIWFPSVPDPEPITWRLLKLGQHPSIGNLCKVLLQATPSAIRS